MLLAVAGAEGPRFPLGCYVPSIHSSTVGRRVFGPTDRLGVAGPYADVAAIRAHLGEHFRGYVVGAEPVHEAEGTDDWHGYPTVDPSPSAQRAIVLLRGVLDGHCVTHPTDTSPRPAEAATIGCPSRRRS